MEDKKSSILLFICTLVMATMLILLYAQEKKLYDYKQLVSSIDFNTIVTTTDTVYETKTLTDTVPQFITRWKTKRDTLFKENDSIPHVVQLKGKTYCNTVTDSNDTIEYQAHISGYDVDSVGYPRLDSIEFNLRRFITQTNTTQVVNVPKKRQFITTSPSITLGYDPLNKQWGAMVGVSLNFNVWK